MLYAHILCSNYCAYKVVRANAPAFIGLYAFLGGECHASYMYTLLKNILYLPLVLIFVIKFVFFGFFFF